MAVSKNDVARCLSSTDDVGAARRGLRSLVENSWKQQQNAHAVFDVLDSAGKGVVVLEDLVAISNDILGEEVTAEDLEGMFEMADSSRNGLLTRKDFVRLVRRLAM